jgi:hypothetical protein
VNAILKPFVKNALGIELLLMGNVFVRSRGFMRMGYQVTAKRVCLNVKPVQMAMNVLPVKETDPQSNAFA